MEDEEEENKSLNVFVSKAKQTNYQKKISKNQAVYMSVYVTLAKPVNCKRFLLKEAKKTLETG